ncbi:prepilin-type N-terminal cleavage/methylation domain-containing protein [Psychrobacter sp.]|uniref:PilW family protein n=1 Tax=Psychrobacter sp. TaxID=56811 RepID=UPI0025E83C63|nr:prepilin-type N-terminal cleavage/methylation domain-containing protein [Psychrobacter sp.]
MIVKELLIKNCHTIQANNTKNNTKSKSKSKSKNDPNDLVSLTEHGFTLIELMLSMSLGLLISAAAFQLFTHSISSQRLQQSMSDVQDVAVFGFNAMSKEIAHANLGASYPMRQNSAWTGIVLTGSEQGEQITKEGLPIKVGNLRGVRGIESEWLTRNNAGPSNIVARTKSDQLTIQYRAPYNSYDCEGRHIEQGDIGVCQHSCHLFTN